MEVDRIKLLAKEKGVTLVFICSKLGLNRGYLKDIAGGKGTISEDRLEAIADILGTTTDYLHGKTDEKNKPITEDGLNTEERKVLDTYRGMTEQQKKELWTILAEK